MPDLLLHSVSTDSAGRPPAGLEAGSPSDGRTALALLALLERRHRQYQRAGGSPGEHVSHGKGALLPPPPAAAQAHSYLPVSAPVMDAACAMMQIMRPPLLDPKLERRLELSAALAGLLIQIVVWAAASQQLTATQHGRQAAMCALWATIILLYLVMQTNTWLQYRRACIATVPGLHSCTE